MSLSLNTLGYIPINILFLNWQTEKHRTNYMTAELEASYEFNKR